MKLTKQRLKQIIKEEIAIALHEAVGPRPSIDWSLFPPGIHNYETFCKFANMNNMANLCDFRSGQKNYAKYLEYDSKSSNIQGPGDNKPIKPRSNWQTAQNTLKQWDKTMGSPRIKKGGKEVSFRKKFTFENKQ